LQRNCKTFFLFYTKLTLTEHILNYKRAFLVFQYACLRVAVVHGAVQVAILSAAGQIQYERERQPIALRAVSSNNFLLHIAVQLQRKGVNTLFTIKKHRENPFSHGADGVFAI